MKARVLTGLFGSAFAIALLVFAPVLAVRIAAVLVCVIGMYELLSTVKLNKHAGLLTVASLFAAGVPFWDMLPDPILIPLIVLVYVLLLAIIQLVCNQTLRIEDTVFLVATSVTIILPIGTLVYLCAIPDYGRAYIFLALIIAWLADIGAYFAGTLLGKHKLCPNISPKKTVEGLIGGMVCSVLSSLLGAWIFQTLVLADSGMTVIYWQVALVALVFSPLSVIGDLICSVIKRQKGIKDFGNLFPGHGGVLDRFDSLIFIAPALYILCGYLPMVTTIA